jgi:hypothetical protein
MRFKPKVVECPGVVALGMRRGNRVEDQFPKPGLAGVRARGSPALLAGGGDAKMLFLTLSVVDILELFVVDREDVFTACQ